MSKDDEFLCKAEEVAALMRDMSGDQHFAYLKSRFRAIDIASGTPTRDMRGGKCQALNLTCTIDAFGNVYPCCFLFDDNNDRSDFREKYRIGSLRPHQEAVDESCEELLRKAWQGDQLNELRNRDLMVDDRACCYCTRHMYNNEFLNELQGILQNCGQHFDLEALEEEILTATPGTGSYWV